MGIVNVTPDSFSDGGRYLDPEAAVAHGTDLSEQGADVLDVGGESTRPGAAPVPVDEELRRVVPVVERLAAATSVPLSVDTTKAAVARAALAAGVAEGAIAADPGIGFGKTVEHNLRLLAGLPALVDRVGVPVMIGASRKTFVGKVLARAGAASGDLPVDQREEGTLATVVWAVERGASIVRVHDVLPAVRAVRLLDALHSADAGAA
jgi:dihydropteroate synthase